MFSCCVERNLSNKGQKCLAKIKIMASKACCFNFSGKQKHDVCFLGKRKTKRMLLINYEKTRK